MQSTLCQISLSGRVLEKMEKIRCGGKIDLFQILRICHLIFQNGRLRAMKLFMFNLLKEIGFIFNFIVIKSV